MTQKSEWIEEVLADIKTFTEANNLPRTSQALQWALSETANELKRLQKVKSEKHLVLVPELSVIRQ